MSGLREKVTSNENVIFDNRQRLLRVFFVTESAGRTQKLIFTNTKCNV